MSGPTRLVVNTCLLHWPPALTRQPQRTASAAAIAVCPLPAALRCCRQLQQGQQRRFDLVIANILRGPLLELQPRLTGYCKPGGRLVLSGILQEQVCGLSRMYLSQHGWLVEWHVMIAGCARLGD